ncbi:DUF6773 family protein [Clostridium transplantifaecale]|uniref:DUF6773 family protein n=1 Tax=Clostridium transplantifaecale TaxID=2479838 RepID=UPI000F640EEA|nr:DUF6773 family protein [Clostridium transplantifaecale]
MKLFKNNMDERQTLEMLQSRKITCWIFYILLLVSLIIQSWLLNLPFAYYGPEFSILLIGGAYLIISDIRRGEWEDFTHMKPGIRAYLLWSAGSAIIASVIFTILQYIRLSASGKVLPFSDILLSSGIFMIFIFCFAFAVLTLVGTLTKKQRKKLDEKYEDPED